MKIKEKLRSSKGASLIIALVFMLFCAMVGSAVLAAATANGGRIAALKSDQQEYLNQRSAATLLSDELQINRPKLTVEKKEVVRTTYTVSDGGVLTPTGSTTTKTIEFKVNGNVATQLQRVLFESAILRYLQANDMDDYAVTISGFTVAGANGSAGTEISSISDFRLYDSVKGENQDPECTLTVDLSKGSVGAGTSVTNFSARVGCSGNKDNLYCFLVDFGNGTTEGMLSLRMYASVSDPRTVKGTEQDADETDSSILVKRDIETVIQTISWDSPEVMKGTVKWEQSETKGAA